MAAPVRLPCYGRGRVRLPAPASGSVKQHAAAALDRVLVLAWMGGTGRLLAMVVAQI